MERRTFVKSAAGAVAAQGMAFAASSRVLGANDRIRVAVLGVNGRGRRHIAGFEALDNVEVVTLVDPDRKIAEERAASFEGRYGRKPAVEQDLRRVLDDQSIDCIGIATPNHWHALAAIWGCQAGKDVYVEKPGAHSIYEGRQLVAAAKKYNRIVQHGVQLRSSVAMREGIQLLRDGIIGDIYLGRACIFKWRPSVGKRPSEAAPAHIDWTMWQGPAEERDFSTRYVHYNWHWHWDYGNGDIGNQGIHETDLMLWGLGVGLPDEVMAMGGKFLWDDDKETPETMTALLKWKKENIMGEIAVRPWSSNYEDGVRVGNIFYGSKGFMLMRTYNSYEVYFGANRDPGPKGDFGGDHYANFIKAVRSRKTSDQHGPVETAHTSSSVAHIANIALQTNRKLDFDPKTERFTNDDEANSYLRRKTYRKGFEVPENV